MLNHSQEPPKPAPKFITMQDNFNNIEEIPVEQENIVAIFKAMGYREVKLEEPEDDDEKR